MFEYHPTLTGFRGFLLVVGLALLGGCAPGSHSSAAGKSSVAAPADLTVTPGNAMVGLSWTASTGATGYNVKRATTSGGPYTQVGAPTSTSYTDTSLTNGTTYYYVVSALDSAGESADSAQVSARPVAPVTIPATPSGLAATPGNAQVALSWTASSAATGYNVKRATTSGGPYTQVGAPTSTSYTDTSLTNGTTYYYVVSALDSAGRVPIPHKSAQRSFARCNSGHTLRPRRDPGKCSGSFELDSQQRCNGLQRETCHHQRRTVHAGRRTDLDLLYRHLAHQRDDLLLRRLALDSAGESPNSAQISALPVAPTGPPPPTTTGTWTDVTPSGVNLTGNLSCGNYGTQTVQVDPAASLRSLCRVSLPGNLEIDGLWDYLDWARQYGNQRRLVSDCAGGIAISPEQYRKRSYYL